MEDRVPWADVSRPWLCIAALLAAGLVAAACGDDDEGGGDGAEPVPAWLVELTDLRPPDVVLSDEGDGEVYVDEEHRTVFVESCDDAEQMTSPGGRFGPEGSEPGYAHVCPTTDETISRVDDVER